jgi:hypothetical protein
MHCGLKWGFGAPVYGLLVKAVWKGELITDQSAASLSIPLGPAVPAWSFPDPTWRQSEAAGSRIFAQLNKILRVPMESNISFLKFGNVIL